MPASSSCRPIEEFPLEKWNAIIAINLSSAFHGIRAAVPGMKKRGWGRIINTASAHSLVASPFKSAYVSAKHGIAGLTKTVALELAHLQDHLQLHLARLCLDAAGRTPDPRHHEGAQHDQGAGHQGRAARRAADQGVRDLEQVAALALYLCGDDAAQITGANLVDRWRVDRGVGAQGPRDGPGLSGRPRLTRWKRGEWMPVGMTGRELAGFPNASTCSPRRCRRTIQNSSTVLERQRDRGRGRRAMAAEARHQQRCTAPGSCTKASA